MEGAKVFLNGFDGGWDMHPKRNLGGYVTGDGLWATSFQASRLLQNSRVLAHIVPVTQHHESIRTVIFQRTRTINLMGAEA